MRYDPPQSVGYMLNLAARLISQRTSERLAPLGVLPGYLPLLFALRELGQSAQAELGERASVEAPTVARTLSRMERDGLVERVTDAADRRRMIVKLTPKAKGLLPQVEQIALEMNGLAAAGLPHQGEATLLDLLGRVVSNLRALEIADHEVPAQGGAVA